MYTLLIFSMTALTAIFLTVLSPGKTLIIPDDLYHGTRTLCNGLLKQWGVKTIAIDMTDLQVLQEYVNTWF